MQQQIRIANLIQKLQRIQKEIDISINYLEEQGYGEPIPRCKKCGWKNIRMRMGGTYFCRSCGYDSKKSLKSKKGLGDY